MELFLDVEQGDYLIACYATQVLKTLMNDDLEIKKNLNLSFANSIHHKWKMYIISLKIHTFHF